MKKRRALLIGVPDYESEAIDNLTVVRHDLENLHSALEQSGYSVRSLGTEGILQTGRSKILQALRQECRRSKGVDTLLFYFSGHGIHYRGQDYLIPSDAVLEDADFIEDYLVSTELGHIIDLAEAKTILFFIDACREGVKLDAKSTYLASWSRGERRKATQRSFVIVFSCGPGQVSQFVPGDEGFSLFSKALSEVVEPKHPACTLEDVIQATQDRLDALVAEHGKRSHEIHHFFESSVKDDVLSRVICEGTLSETITEEGIDPWSNAAWQSPLWNDDEAKDNLHIAQLKQQVLEIIAICWQQWQRAVSRLPNDPWRDAELPIRVLESLDLLVLRSDPQVKLSSAETALIVTIPFLREAVLASGIVHAAEANPLVLGKSDTLSTFRDALDKTHQGQLRFVRKAQRLEDRGCLDDKNAILAWLMYQCLFTSLELWQPKSEGGYLSETFIGSLDQIRCCSSRLVQETLSRKRLLELAQCVFSNLERIDRDDRPGGLQTKLTVGRYREEQIIREKMLAYLLHLAGALAVDFRLLSDVLVDHIGLSDPLTPGQIRETVCQARWNPSGRGRVLRVICSHPAVDLALHQHVEITDSVLTQIFRQVGEKRHRIEALAGLPTHFMADGITAEYRDGVPVYQTPHINFQLAHDEVRELLMGEQLYGDPMLAIRELYQNALDACRYKEARLTYLKQKNEYDSSEENWNGQILFRQGIEDGRAYLECEDNGIGMGIQHLYQCFARAGKRFADLPEFIEEKAEWLKCDPPVYLYPNSQFGVGVLSYFMLADELEVETCRLDRNGRPSQRLQVHIPGSSGLFRVQKLEAGNQSGTRIRLYLNRTHHKGKLISCIETLRKLLWVAEFKTEVFQFGRHEVWQPNQLKHPEYPEIYCLNIENTNIWWIPESEYWWVRKGCILSDGLWTAAAQPGFVFNLRKDKLPRLTVDRKRIVEWDKAWVRKHLIENAEPLIKYEDLDLNSLWKLSRQHPPVASHIVNLLSDKQINIELMSRSTNNLEVPIAKIGCFELDIWLSYFRYGLSVKNLMDQGAMPWWILPYRVILWGNNGLFKISEDFLKSFPKSIQLDENLKPQPGDGLVIEEDFPPLGYRYPCIEDYVPPAHIIHASKKLDEPLKNTVQRFHKFSLLGLKIPEINLDHLDLIEISEEDIIALSRRIDEVVDDLEEGKISWRKPWLEDKISVSQVVLTSTRLNESIADSISRFEKFRPVGLQIENSYDRNLEKVKVNPEDIIALSKSLDGEEAWQSNWISPAQIAFAAKRLNEPITSTLLRFEKFSCIGLDLPYIDLDTLGNFEATEEDFIMLSKGNIGDRTAWAERQISVAQIVQASWRLKEPLDEILKRLQKFVPLGLSIPEVDIDVVKNISVTRSDSILFSETNDSDYLSRRSPWMDDVVGPSHLITGVIKLNASVTDILHQFQKFAPLGLKIQTMDLDLLQTLINSDDDLTVFSRNLTKDLQSPLDVLQGKVHATRIILAALALQESVSITLKRFRRYASVLNLTLPVGKPDTWRLH